MRALVRGCGIPRSLVLGVAAAPPPGSFDILLVTLNETKKEMLTPNSEFLIHHPSRIPSSASTPKIFHKINETKNTLDTGEENP